jgi:FkbM family methyltransferase
MSALDYKSHIGQDRWVAEVLKFKRNGYFLEFGALDGVLTSNTFVLEKELEWQGICVEANPTLYPAVCQNRSCITINAALWPESRTLIDMVDAHGLSSVVAYKNSDNQASLRESVTTRRFGIDTLNPTELLDRFRAPAVIDYMSLDVEGCEIDVLNALDFSRYHIAMMTIEHNHDEGRKAAVRSLLEPLGYFVADRLNDDWIYHPDYLRAAMNGATPENPLKIYREIAESYLVI